MLHYEDFQQGQTFDLGSYYVSADEIVAFAREFDPQPFHLSEDGARDSVFVKFFATDAATITGLSRIASLAKAKVVPAIARTPS